MKWLICCAGEMSRWKNYLNTPKHLVKINGESLLQRTIRLINLYDTDADINIIALNDKYIIPGTNLIKIEEHYKTLPLKSVIHFSSEILTNIMIFGDIYFTENCIKKIADTYIKNCPIFFGREKNSTITLCPYGEIWGIMFNFNHINLIKDSINILERKHKNGKIKRLKHWELYRFLNNIPLKKHKITDNFIEIDDFTEDFDYPIDYDNWIKQYKLFSSKNNTHQTCIYK